MSNFAPACAALSENNVLLILTYLCLLTQESYVTHEDNVRLAGEIISLLGAFVILVLEVKLWNMFYILYACVLHCHIILYSLFQQIPDILRVGAKRYFGQTALGGPFHVILWVENTYLQKISQTDLKYPLTSLFYFNQYQLRVPGGAAVCVQSLRGAGRGCGDVGVFGPRLEQRHVLRPRFWNARPLCHHDTEGRAQKQWCMQW